MRSVARAVTARFRAVPDGLAWAVISVILGNRLEQWVEVDRRAERGGQGGGVEPGWAEVVNDHPAIVEQGFKIQKFDVPAGFVHDARTGWEPVEAFSLGNASAFQVVGCSGSEDAGSLVVRSAFFREAGWGFDQDLAEFGPAM